MLCIPVFVVLVTSANCLLRVTHAADICAHHEFPCENGQCILKTKWCDSIDDCIDDSDERYCSRKSLGYNINKCGSHHFECLSGPCIPISGKCDGYASCSDGSDEKNCESNEIKTQPSTLHTTSKPNTTAISTESPRTTPSQPPTTPRTTKKPTTTSTHKHTTTTHTTHSTHTPQHNAQPIHHSSHVMVLEKPHQYSPTLELDITRFVGPKVKAMRWLLSQRNLDHGWKDTARAVVALYLANPDYFRNKTLESASISNQLQLQLSIDLVRNQSKPMGLSDLSLYVNALLATCNNPRNFHGIDLVHALRERTNLAQASNKFVSPLVYLTLCAVDETVRQDVKKVQDFFLVKDSKANKLEILALATLAASCINHIPKYYASHIARDTSNRLLRQWTMNGMTSNIYSSALVAQAFKATMVNGSLWKKSEVIETILARQDKDGSFGDIMATYYILPLLSGRTLASIHGFHCYDYHENGLTPLEVLKNTKRHHVYVLFSLYIGDPVEVSHSLQLKVPEGTNFFDIMRLAQELNPVFRFQYDDSEHPPVVYSIGGVPNDAERGVYWSLHLSSHKHQNSTSHIVPYTDDITRFVPEAGDDVIFWLRNLS